MTNKKKTVIILSIIVVLAIAFGLYKYSEILLSPTLKKNDISTCIVDRGTISSALDASGVVESQNEVLILSPSSSIIKSILKEPGSKVKKGESIILLDTEPIEDNIEKIEDQLEMKRNSLDKNRLNSRSIRVDLSYNEEVKNLKIVSLKSQLKDQEQLFEVGGISSAKIDKTKQEITLAEKELETLKEKNTIKLKQLLADEKGLLLQIRVQEKDMADKQELLEKMQVRAPSDGIILVISGREGGKADKDKMLVKLSNLSAFKVKGFIDEIYADHIKTGKLVSVHLDNEILEGRVGTVAPLVENKKIQFNVHLDQNNHPKLIPNMQVQLRVFQSVRDSVLRIRRHENFGMENELSLYVLYDGKAVRQDVKFGIRNAEYIEIVSGLNEGDAIITDGVSKYTHLKEIEIHN
jgi:HlyD family secretion protein